ncbi:MAG TPA: subclass B3 metallo-beta-lactamase [Flavisolibacter sp.]|nr:subclass B3 metallo-beta-lactamase [Flavisolibacter sp.]
MAALAGLAVRRFLFRLRHPKRTFIKIWSAFLALVSVLFVFLFIKWKAVSDAGGQIRQEPFKIAGNLYYVGTKDVTSFLITSSKGHILIDGGYPGTPDLILENIKLLGFKASDIKILLNSHAHLDHAGGLAALQKKTGATLWISEPDAATIRAGGANSRNMGIMNFLVYTGLARFPAPHIDHTFKDGEKIILDSMELTGYITPGHTPGCTTWAFTVRENNQALPVVIVGSLTLLPVSLFGEKYDSLQQAQFQQSFRKLRSLPVAIFLASHGNMFHLVDKIQKRKGLPAHVNPFIDSSGYYDYIESAEKQFDKAIQEQKRKQKKP